MRSVELYPQGSFRYWDPHKLQELKEARIFDSFEGGTLMFENDYLKLWELTLAPGERLPFCRKNTNYSWTCISGGQTVTHCADGSITCYLIEKGETLFFDFSKQQRVSDVKNTGKNILVIHIIEYKQEAMQSGQ